MQHKITKLVLMMAKIICVGSNDNILTNGFVTTVNIGENTNTTIEFLPSHINLFFIKLFAFPQVAIKKLIISIVIANPDNAPRSKSSTTIANNTNGIIDAKDPGINSVNLLL